jgi:hypothetical protein
LNEV